MSGDDIGSRIETQATPEQEPRKFDDLPPAAQRALKEAEARRAALTAKTDDLPAEVGGRGGKDPARYDDWEVKGIAIDF